MRVVRHYVDAALAEGAIVPLPEDAVAHLVRVLRLGLGDPVTLFNGDGFDYAARISSLSKKAAEAQVLTQCRVENESDLHLTLAQGIARGEKMDLILQKATELGVVRIAPVVTERTEVRLDNERAAKRMLHWRGVVVAACEQSGRARLPEVMEPQTLAHFASDATPGLRFILDPLAEKGIADAGIEPGQRVTLLIGPEGGLSERDRLVLRAAGYQGLRLGPRILRTETAGLAALAAINALFGDWR
ncbi:MAG: 16S rRNA (uracil(1498)-N(3))-methyltransferase [Gammaproteobacteria bacterium]|nr:16S rRNA (uracil(1498)-N(3))-methyltransferase [Gammaproteobacteria bacterium]